MLNKHHQHPTRRKEKKKNLDKQYALHIAGNFSWQHVLDLDAHRTLQGSRFPSSMWELKFLF